jgi:hypothetical protein
MDLPSAMAKSAAAAGLHWSEISLMIGGFIVVVGLIGEYVERWKHYLKVFEVMVILGVAIELIADGGIYVFSERVQEIADLQVATLERESSNAKKMAAEAMERASANERETARIKNTNLALESDLLRLRLQAQPRRLSTAQRDEMSAKFKGTTHAVMIYSKMNDQEAFDFANDLDSVFRAAGWKTFRSSNRVNSGYGVLLGCVDCAEEPFVKSIDSALTSGGVRHNLVNLKNGDQSMSPNVEKGVLYLIVDEKPPLDFK